MASTTTTVTIKVEEGVLLDLAKDWATKHLKLKPSKVEAHLKAWGPSQDGPMSAPPGALVEVVFTVDLNRYDPGQDAGGK